MTVQMTNNACSTIINGIDDVETTIVIGAEGALFPQLQAGEWYYGTLTGATGAGDENQLPEIVKVTGVSGPDGSSNYTLTVVRAAGIDGQPAKSWLADSNFQLLVTSELLYDLQSGGVTLSGATSWILNSTSVISQVTRDVLVSENGYLLGVTTNSVDDTVLQLPAIPAPDFDTPGGLEDIRYYIVNRTANGTGTGVVVTAAVGETIKQFASVKLTQRNSAMVLHAKRGNNFWDAMTTMDFDEIPEDGKVYGVTHGPDWVAVVENPPSDGVTYLREGDTWVEGVEEAPKDGNQYVRQDGAWVIMPEIIEPVYVAAATDLSQNQSMSTVNAFAKINFDRVVFDPDGLFDGAGVFTCPYPGVYNINVFINCFTFNRGSGVGLKYYINDVAKKFFADTDSAKDTNDVAVSGSYQVLLNEGDTLYNAYRVEESGRYIAKDGYFTISLTMPIAVEGAPEPEAAEFTATQEAFNQAVSQF